MPEGHTIHRQAREHNKALRGQIVHADSPQGRFVEGAAAIDGRMFVRAEAVGKHLFHRYDGRVWLHVHLGLYGKWRTGLLPPPPPVGAVRLRLWTAQQWWELRGATAVEIVTEDDVEAIRARLGPDPLRRDADPDRAYHRIARSRAPIGALLMDQSVLAGVGNVYRAEVLFRHGLDPHRPGREVTARQWEDMWSDLRVLMADGVRRNKIITIRKEDRALSRPRRGGPVPCATNVYVYRRQDEPCLLCGTPVRTEKLLARNLFWCPVCQPERLGAAREFSASTQLSAARALPGRAAG